jgi:hypothetical protein
VTILAARNIVGSGGPSPSRNFSARSLDEEEEDFSGDNEGGPDPFSPERLLNALKESERRNRLLEIDMQALSARCKVEWRSSADIV